MPPQAPWITLDSANVSSRIREGKIALEPLYKIPLAARLLGYSRTAMALFIPPRLKAIC